MKIVGLNHLISKETVILPIKARGIAGNIGMSKGRNDTITVSNLWSSLSKIKKESKDRILDEKETKELYNHYLNNLNNELRKELIKLILTGEYRE